MAASTDEPVPPMLRISGLRLASEADRAEILELESSSYPADEAATPAKIDLRLREAGLFFYVLRSDEGALVGFVCGTLAADLTEESMAVHDPAGSTLCIHSVVTAPDMRKQGVATWMTQQYCRLVAQTASHVTGFALLAKKHNIRLYARCGFVNCGPSGVDHGVDTWLLMKRPVHPSERQPPLLIVDAFSSKPIGGGNQAGVVILPSAPLPTTCVVCGTPGADAEPEAADPGTGIVSEWMQAVAIELGFSETAFLQPLRDGSWSLRWFTPGGEVDLCGHATLASASALKRSGSLHPRAHQVLFASRSGCLSATYGAEEGGGASLNFPAEPATAVDAAAEAAIVAVVAPALWPSATDEERRGHVQAVARNRMDVLVHVTTSGFNTIPAVPNAAALKAVTCRGIIVTAAAEEADGDLDFVSRFFAPLLNIDEDPVTGSAHCCLAPFWAPILGKTAMTAEQRSARGGRLQVEFVESDGRVLLAGDCAVTVEGSLAVSLPSL